MKVAFVGAALLAAAQVCAGAGVLAIDYGTDAFKALLVKPGLPFDVLINPDSKRKTPNVVYLKDDTRVYGGEAANLAVKSPKDTYSGVKLLLGEGIDSPLSKLHEALFLTEAKETSRGTRIAGNYTAEELVANHLSYAKELAEAESGEPVSDVVVTIPPWYGPVQRQALLTSVDLVGLRGLALIHDGSAVAINYATARAFDKEPVYHLMYDFGSGPVVATVVSIRSELRAPATLLRAPKAKDYVNTTVIEATGYGFDKETAGYILDKAVRDILGNKFRETVAPLPANDAKVNAKLLREAGRVKHILSANADCVARIEGLYDDMDLRTTVTRAELEAYLGSSFSDALKQPIYDALKEAGLSVDKLGSVILTGGNTRVPLVQKAVADVVGQDKVAVNVNADEAAVMGAALYGASASRAFRTKPFALKDKIPFAFSFGVEGGVDDVDSHKEVLFPSLSEVGLVKNVTLPFATTYAFKTYTEGVEEPLVAYNLSLLSYAAKDAVHNLTEEEKATAHVDIVVGLSNDGLPVAREAHVVAPPPKKKSVLSGLFGAKKDNGTEDSPAPTKYINFNVVPLHFNGVKRMPISEKNVARTRLRELRAAERRRIAREEARNALEALVYKVRDALTLDEFTRHAQAAEKARLEALAAQYNEWLWDEGDTAETTAFSERHRELSSPLLAVHTRKSDHESAESLRDEFAAYLGSVSEWMEYARNNTREQLADGQPARWPEQEIALLESAVTEAVKWLEAAFLQQKAVALDKDAVLSSAAVKEKKALVDAQHARLQKMKPPRRVPKSSSTAAQQSSTAAQQSTTETASTATASTTESSATATTTPARDPEDL